VVALKPVEEFERFNRIALAHFAWEDFLEFIAFQNEQKLLREIAEAGTPTPENPGQPYLVAERKVSKPVEQLLLRLLRREGNIDICDDAISNPTRRPKPGKRAGGFRVQGGTLRCPEHRRSIVIGNLHRDTKVANGVSSSYFALAALLARARCSFS
jgi:hypothetical protein